MTKKWALVLHGGAGPIFGQDYSAQEKHLASLLKDGGKRSQSSADSSSGLPRWPA